MTSPKAGGDWQEYAAGFADRARRAAAQLSRISGADKQRWLLRSAERLRQNRDLLIAENRRDLERAPEFGLSNAAIDRLRLDQAGIEKLAKALHEVAALTDPVGEIIEGAVRPNGLNVCKTRVPLGVVLFIYESRPNVTVDAAALCVKSGNAVILRGGKEALFSNLALYRELRAALEETGLPVDAVQLVDNSDRAIVGALLQRGDAIDVAIPRGGKSLIERVAHEATMPVIKHFDGICHVYVDRSADVPMAARILINAKCQRPGVCNAAECVLVHRDIAGEFFAAVRPLLQDTKTQVRGCPRTRELLPEAVPATDEDYRTEFLDLILASKVVDNLDEAIDHINEHGSHHTDAIVTSDVASADRFLLCVDSAAVIVNASTRFNDGGELGLGAEIGISTDKFHARGPCGLRELTTYKWIIRGSGQIRG
ncbi:MAG: glutamate-5-semialdehyde dehydrogenase [Planctomycetaceae bacterium]|nr:glutamate-5-semialdehyde dehydrogenase [Planctomycetaceae bacterium]